jgi:hypothetical protein
MHLDLWWVCPMPQAYTTAMLGWPDTGGLSSVYSGTACPQPATTCTAFSDGPARTATQTHATKLSDTGCGESAASLCSGSSMYVVVQCMLHRRASECLEGHQPAHCAHNQLAWLSALSCVRGSARVLAQARLAQAQSIGQHHHSHRSVRRGAHRERTAIGALQAIYIESQMYQCHRAATGAALLAAADRVTCDIGAQGAARSGHRPPQGRPAGASSSRQPRPPPPPAPRQRSQSRRWRPGTARHSLCCLLHHQRG